MTIVMVVQKWRLYLLGQRFFVHTNQSSLKFILEQRLVVGDYQRLMTKLMGYDFDIVCKLDMENKVANALSRIPNVVEFAVVSLLGGLNSGLILDQQMDNNKLISIRNKLLNGKDIPVRYSLKGSLLYYCGKIVFPEDSPTIPFLLEVFHSSPVGGHGGVLRTYQRRAREVYWVGMKAHVKVFVFECFVCQQAKYLVLAPMGLLQPLPIPDNVWEDISMDFVIDLPRAKTFDSVLVVVDRISKYMHFITVKHPFTVVSIARVFIKEVVRCLLAYFGKSCLSGKVRC